MATYLDLRNRIITETNRDDLSDTLASNLKLHIQQAIEYYAGRRFWFNEGIKTGVCVIGNEYANKPTGMRVVDRVTVAVGAVQYGMTPKPLIYVDEMAIITTNGQPTIYAETGDTIRMWPKPQIAYPLSFIGIVDLAALVNDADTNAWTVQGYDLITARAKFTLFRNQFYDDAKANNAMAEEADARNKLTRETADRLGSGMAAHG